MTQNATGGVQRAIFQRGGYRTAASHEKRYELGGNSRGPVDAASRNRPTPDSPAKDFPSNSNLWPTAKH